MIYTVTLNPAVDRELTVPAITFDSVLRAVDWRVDLGGKGFNVSRMLIALETPSTALGFAGGKSGESLQEGLLALGIATDFVWVAGETRTNVSIVTSAHDRYVKVNEPGPTIGPHSLEELRQRVSRLAAPGDWWVLSGSLPPGVPDDVYGELIGLIHQAGGAAILDTSGPALEHGCRAAPFLVKPNDVELHKLTGLPVGDRGQIAAAAEVARRLGPANVVVSLGKAGALLVDNHGQTWLAGSPKIEERNPIGAGDAMVGGLVWALSQGRPVAEALRWGIACGAATASLSGTAVGDLEMVTRLVEDTTLSPLSAA